MSPEREGITVARFDVAGRRLGSLEIDVLRQLWATSAPVTAQELAAALPGPRRAQTTVLTVLSRLAAKGLVQRVDDVAPHRYRAAGNRDQLTAQAIERLLTAASDRRAVLAHLVGELASPELRAELAALLQPDPPQ